MQKQDYSFGVIPFRYRVGQLEYLLIQHREGHWAFPKGHREGNENEQETALRELQEETGLTPLRLLEVPPITEEYDPLDKNGQPFHKTVKYYLGEIDAAVKVTIQESELQNYAWLSFEPALARQTFEVGKQTLTTAHELLTRL